MDFKLPEIGEGLEEGELISWLVKAGDSVEVDQPLVEVMTDKATVEIPATSAGVVKDLKANEGDMIKVGQVIAVIEEGASASSGESKEATADDKETSSEAAAPENGNGKSKGFGFFADDAPKEKSSPNKAPEAGAYQSPQEQLSPSSVPAAPIVRAMAQKAGVNLEQVPASGPNVGGVARVLEEDLINYLNNQSSTLSTPTQSTVLPSGTATPAQNSSAAPSAPTKALPSNSAGEWSEEVERKPLRGLRRVISQAMAKSKYTAPHYAYVDEFECSELIKLRERAKVVAADYGLKFSYLPFIVKALVGALKEYPIVNSSLEENDKGAEIVFKKFYHIGIAVATDEGLVVPVIKHADKKSLLQIAQEITELSAKTRAGKAKPEELRGSTFTITSMGNLGGKFATPIINYPEVGIMGVYRAQEKPVVKNGEIVVGNVMPISLSLDHRVVDGAVGSLFCTAIIDRLKDPAKLMLEMS